MNEKLILLVMFVVAMIVGAMISQPNKTSDPERARFLLECQYDWMLSNEECHRLLDGGDPPEKPPEWTGC